MDNQNPQTVSSPTPVPQQSQPVVSHSSPSAGPSKTFLFAIVFVLLVGVGAGAYFLGVKNTQPVSEPAVTTPIVSTPIPTIDPTANWQTYTNTQYNFSIKYPSTWTANAKTNKLQLPGEILKGPEGEIDIVWGSGFGGGCVPGKSPVGTAVGPEQVQINGESLQGCHVINTDGSESWNAIGKVLSTISIMTNATVSSPAVSNKPLVMSILSTFTFTAASPTGGTSQTQTNNNSCTSNLLKLTISYPDSWTCTTESSSDTFGLINLKSSLFTVEISNGGRGPYCGEGGVDPNCKTSLFYEDNVISLTTYNSNGQDKEIFGPVKQAKNINNSITWISVKYTNMETTPLTATQKQELITVLDSIK